MLLGVALGTPAGIAGSIFYIVHHILVQTALFIVVGLIERVGGSTSLARLGGLASVPLLAVLYLLPALNLGGIPPFSGFLAKIGLLQAGVAMDQPLVWALVAGSVVTSLLTLLVMVRVWTRSFWRRVEDVEHPPAKLVLALEDAEARRDGKPRPSTFAKGPARGMAYPTVGLVALGLAFTVWAGPLYAFSDRAATDMLARTPYIEAVLGPEAAEQAVQDVGSLEDRGIIDPGQENSGPGELDSIRGDSEGHNTGSRPREDALTTEGGQP